MIKRLLMFFGDYDLPTITTEEIQGFPGRYTAGGSSTTNKARFSFANAFFNLVRDNLDHTVQNPCNTQALKRQFRPPVNRSRKIIEKDIADEMIFKAESDRDRLFPMPHASGSGVPIEIVSKVVLRHSNLATTQIYQGRVSDEKAFKWVEDVNR